MSVYIPTLEEEEHFLRSLELTASRPSNGPGRVVSPEDVQATLEAQRAKVHQMRLEALAAAR